MVPTQPPQQQPVVDYHAARNGTIASVGGSAVFTAIIVWVLTDFFKVDVPPSIDIAINAALGMAGAFFVHGGQFIVDRLAPIRIPGVDRPPLPGPLDERAFAVILAEELAKQMRPKPIVGA